MCVNLRYSNPINKKLLRVYIDTSLSKHIYICTHIKFNIFTKLCQCYKVFYKIN